MNYKHLVLICFYSGISLKMAAINRAFWRIIYENHTQEILDVKVAVRAFVQYL